MLIVANTLQTQTIWWVTCSTQWRCNAYLYVRSYLVAQNIWGVTRQHTAKVRLTIVSKARNHLVKLQLWKHTCSLTEEKTHTCSECRKLFGLAHNLKMRRCKERAYNCVQCNKSISLLVKLQVWKRIWSSTVEWWATLAQNVRSHLVKQDIWRRTW